MTNAGARIAQAASRSPRPWHGGPASKRIVTGYGFWIFLLSDIVMFSGFFAAYAVLRARPRAARRRAICSISNVAIETACLLLSSFTCGLAASRAEARSMLWTQVGAVVTGLLGLAFLGLEVSEFPE